jgi:hypothetical protein
VCAVAAVLLSFHLLQVVENRVRHKYSIQIEKHRNTSLVKVPKKKGKFQPKNPALLKQGHHAVDIPFDNPSTYEGPIVDGWPPEMDRNINLYIRPEEDTLLTGTGS